MDPETRRSSARPPPPSSASMQTSANTSPGQDPPRQTRRSPPLGRPLLQLVPLHLPPSRPIAMPPNSSAHLQAPPQRRPAPQVPSPLLRALLQGPANLTTRPRSSSARQAPPPPHALRDDPISWHKRPASVDPLQPTSHAIGTQPGPQALPSASRKSCERFPLCKHHKQEYSCSVRRRCGRMQSYS